MTRNVEHVIDAAENPEIGIVIALRTVAREVEIRTIGPLREVSLDVALVVAPNSAQHRRPRLRHRQQAAADFNSLRSGVEQIRGIAGERLGGTAWFGSGDAGQRRDHDRPRLRLPPGIYDRTTIAADVLAIPHPRFGVDRLTNRAE